MLVTQQPVLRRFWYALMPISMLDDGPKPFTLLGEHLVLWKGADGKPAALQDRCCHHTAKLLWRHDAAKAEEIRNRRDRDPRRDVAGIALAN